MVVVVAGGRRGAAARATRGNERRCVGTLLAQSGFPSSEKVLVDLDISFNINVQEVLAGRTERK